MTRRIAAVVTCTASALSCVFTATLAAAQPPVSVSQEMISLPVRVVDTDGHPVAGAKVIPWALRSSQGHGAWTEKKIGSEPPTLITDNQGRAEVPYPRFTYLDERVQTTEVTLSIDHPDYVYVMYEFINVPRAESEPHEIKLKRGAVVEVLPLLDGKAAPAEDLEDLHVLWSGGRPSKEYSPLARAADGALRVPALAEGTGQILVVRLEGERATHFSSIVELDLKAGETVRRDVELQPSVAIHGQLSANVPRPVLHGRVKAWTLPSGHDRGERVDWYTWAPVDEDGSFVIDDWPAGEDVQIIALCDGFHGTSGDVVDLIRFLPKAAGELQGASRTGWGVWRADPFLRPQLFTPEEQRSGIAVQMTPTVRVPIETVDEQGAPIAGVKVLSCPNVGWRNIGSQIYCTPLVRKEAVLVSGSYEASVESAYAAPFQIVSADDGWGEMELPAGPQNLYAEHEAFELPVDQGRRDQRIEVAAGMQPVRLAMQQKGKEYLGEWDKLAGVLFGCTGEQCRRLLEDPGFKKRITAVRERFDKAKNPKDPKLLKAAYEDMAKAFDELKDQEEAEKWRRKATEQAAKAGSSSVETSAQP
jgi:hypothetical protein